MSTTILEYMRKEHRECDAHFAAAEQRVALKEWDEASAEFKKFAMETLAHFKKEEEMLFEAFEKQSGNTMGPTRVMRYEHEQVRALLGKMNEALASKDRDAYLSLAESMMILLQQHNMKEEQMLYAMCDAILPPEVKADTIEAMKQTVL